jgi:hypothetical protein
LLLGNKIKSAEAIDVGLFNQAAMETYGTIMTLSTKEIEMVVKPPTKYKAGTKWKGLKEGAIAYLNGIKGKHNIPLTYIIRENKVPQVLIRCINLNVTA